MAERASAITSRIVGITDRLRPQRHGSVDADSLAKEILRHYPEGDAELVRRAYAYAAEAHEGQKRISGEPYITHPAALWPATPAAAKDPRRSVPRMVASLAILGPFWAGF